MAPLASDGSIMNDSFIASDMWQKKDSEVKVIIHVSHKLSLAALYDFLIQNMIKIAKVDVFGEFGC